MLIKVKVFPKSKKESIIQLGKDSFEIKVKERPLRGEANQAVISALSSYFKIPKDRIRMVRGFRKRNKVFEIKK